MRPPFHANPDQHHCLQSTLRMALEASEPGAKYSLRILDILTQRRPSEGTWTHAAYLALGGLPVQALAIDPFDYATFAERPVKAVFETFPPEVAMGMAAGFDLVAASQLARELVEREPIPIEVRSATLDDVDRMLGQGWLLIANVDAGVLDGRASPSGHSVLIWGREGDQLRVHDPGENGTGRPDRLIDRDLFVRAWSYMGDDHRELIGIRAGEGDP